MPTEITIDDIGELEREVELGAHQRTRTESWESGHSGQHHKPRNTDKSCWLLVGIFIFILYALVIANFVADYYEDHHLHGDEVMMSYRTSIKGYDLQGALYAGQGEWAKKLDMPSTVFPADGVSDLQVVACGAPGKIYILGGVESDETVLDSVVEFDSTFQTYEMKAPMPLPRYRFGSACVDGVIYVTGGFTDVLTGDAGESVNTTFAYDVAKGTWTPRAAMQTPRGDIAMEAVDGKVYTFGGYGFRYEPADTVVEVYDIATNTWAFEKAPMPSRRGDAVAVAVGHDIYVLGGWVSEDEGRGFKPSTSAEKFDTVTRTWTTVADMKIARGDAAAVAFGDKLYMIGGETSTAAMGLAWDETGNSVTNIPLHDVEQYDIANDIWIQMKPIPSPRFRFGAAVAVAQGAIFTFGGHAEGTRTVNTVQAFYYLDRPNLFLHAEHHAEHHH